MSYIYLAHVKCWNPVTLAETTLYLSSQGYVTGASNLPPGGVAHICYDDRIKQPALIRRSCWKDKTSGGQSEVSYGAVVNINIDGGLDFLMPYGLHGRDITLIRGEVQEDTAPVPTWDVVFQGKMARPYMSRSTFNLHLRDRLEELNKTLCANVYAGTNGIGGVFLEGGEDIAGQNKPRVFGRPRTVSPVCVNDVKRIYQFNDGALANIFNVRDRGVTILKGADYVSLADLEANVPAEGYYRAWLPGGYIRLGRDPTGMITGDPIEGAAASDRTCAKVVNAILTAGGIDPANISSADLAALDVVQSSETGFYWQDNASCTAAIDRVCKTAGAWWTFDRLDLFRIKRFDAPVGAPVLTLTSVEIIDIEPVNLDWCDVPVWQSTIRYSPNTVVQKSDIASGVDVTTRTMLAQEYMQKVTSNTAIKTAYPLAGELVFDTDFVSAGNAHAENTRRFNLYNVQRYAYRVIARLSQAQVSLINLGTEVRVQLDRFALDAGKNFIVIEMEEDHAKGEFIGVELMVFG